MVCGAKRFGSIRKPLMEKNMTTPETYQGSTGSMGFMYRSDRRAYLNQPGIMHDASYVLRLGRVGREIVHRERNRITRCVLRGMVPGTVLSDILSHADEPLVEAAVPTGFMTTNNGRASEPIWMMLAAVNHPTRRPLFPVTEMIHDVDQSGSAHAKTPVGRISELRREGYTFLRQIPARFIRDVLHLWGDSFHWDGEAIENLRRTIAQGSAIKPNDRHVWFTGILSPQRHLVALATAERLDVPLEEGKSISVVESTEWRRSPDAQRSGLAAAAVSHLTAQVLADIGDRNPLVIAETNYRSGAHHVGFAAGMEVPSRSHEGRSIPQMLIQNVGVGDGLLPKGPESKRDFTMMYLPYASIQTLYTSASRESMLKGGV